VILSTLWIFFVINILYADVLNILGEASPGDEKGSEIVNTLLSPELLLGTAVFLELAMVMIVLSRLLKYSINRWVNIIIASIHALGLLASLFVGTPAIYYVFFVIVELITLLFIIWYSWTWTQSEVNN
jgi:hypothetical protein